jgi:hypothetical protein
VVGHLNKEIVMRIGSKISGDLECKAIKKYGQTQTRMATFVVKVGVSAKEAAKKFGDEFHRIAFGLMTQGDGVVKHCQQKITKPALVCEAHQIKVLGHKVRVIPEINEIVLVENEPEAIVPITLSLPCEQISKELIADLASRCGDVVEFDFKPELMELPGVNTGPVIKKKTAGYGNVVPVTAA